MSTLIYCLWLRQRSEYRHNNSFWCSKTCNAKFMTYLKWKILLVLSFVLSFSSSYLLNLTVIGLIRWYFSSVILLVFSQSSLSYLTGSFLLFSNSKEGSTANSLPALFLNAFVHLAFRGFFFFLKFFVHFDRQNLKIWK